MGDHVVQGHARAVLHVQEAARVGLAVDRVHVLRGELVALDGQVSALALALVLAEVHALEADRAAVALGEGDRAAVPFRRVPIERAPGELRRVE